MTDITAGALLQTTLVIGTDRATVTLTGEIDRFTAPTLAVVLDTVLGSDAALVEVQMAKVSFIDVEGLRVLARAHFRGAQQGVTLTLSQPTPQALWLMRITDTAALLLDTAAPDNGHDTPSVNHPSPAAQQPAHPSPEGRFYPW